MPLAMRSSPFVCTSSCHLGTLGRPPPAGSGRFGRRGRPFRTHPLRDRHRGGTSPARAAARRPACGIDRDWRDIPRTPSGRRSRVRRTSRPHDPISRAPAVFGEGPSWGQHLCATSRTPGPPEPRSPGTHGPPGPPDPRTPGTPTTPSHRATARGGPPSAADTADAATSSASAANSSSSGSGSPRRRASASMAGAVSTSGTNATSGQA
jgi:hypothetical protein